MAAVLFVTYLYIPVRLMVSLAMAVTFSVAAPLWWWQIQHPAVSYDEILRGITWLVLTNALAFIAANSLQRSQRAQFAQQRALEELLSTDALTGIANRRRLDAALAREWRRCARVGAPLSLLMIDVDHFKAFNDTYGHPAGDECLRKLARCLKKTIKRPADTPARYGGEELTAVLPDTLGEGAFLLADEFRTAVRDLAIPHSGSDKGIVTVSIGVSTLDRGGGVATCEDLVRRADEALYAAKEAGRDRVQGGRPALAAVGAAKRA
jgi:diguanylate cyclase (GGDEF)-like protein